MSVLTSPQPEDSYPLVSEAVAMERDMCKKMVLGKPYAEVTEADVRLLKQSVAVHGAICLVGAHLGPKELKTLADMYGKVLTLPPGLAFNAQLEGLPQVARVGNVQQDGTVKSGHSAAEYWHHDGNFWPVGQNHIINFLSAVEVPEQGGKTGFLDTRKAYLALSEEQKSVLQDAFTVVHAGDISDFKDAPEEERPVDVAHRVLQKDPITGELSLYLPASYSGIQAADGAKIGDSTDFIAAIEQDSCQGVFEFQWTIGDLMIWDNRSTMHKSMGGYSNSRRLLYRCQARVTQES